MKRVTGIGGIFFKSRDPERLESWYEKHLGIVAGEDGSVTFRWREPDDPAAEGCTAWAPFPADTTYFAPSASTWMINYRVDDLDALLAELRREGVVVDERIEEQEYGRFGWAMDPEGNRIELWEPPRKRG